MGWGGGGGEVEGRALRELEGGGGVKEANLFF
jgi:hypothetical protein